MNVSAKKNDLHASIGQTDEASNESYGMRGRSSVMVVMLLLCFSGFASAGAIRSRTHDSAVLRDVLLLLLHANQWKINTAKESEGVRALGIRKVVLSRFGMLHPLAENLEKIDVLAKAEGRDAEELLHAIFEYYKVLFCLCALKSAVELLPNKGKSLHPFLEYFFSFYSSQDRSYQQNKTEKAKFIKAAMTVVNDVETLLYKHKEPDARTFFAKNLFLKMHQCLPPCNLEVYHTPEACYRCSANNVFDILVLGLVEKKVDAFSDVQEHSPLVVRMVWKVGIVVGAVFLFWKISGKIPKLAGRAWGFCQDFIKKCSDFGSED